MIRVSVEHGGEVERIVLDGPKGHILDDATVGLLRGHVDSLRTRRSLKLIVFEGEGANFSYGASVVEHLPDRVEGMLTGFHGLFRDLESLSVPMAAIVRGQCLGGGLELALTCGMIACDPTARMGLPEVRLGVFPPIGALLLPERVGNSVAARMIVTGEVVTGEQAAAIGLAERCDTDPNEAIEAFYAQMAPHSAVAVRFGWGAARHRIRALFTDTLPKLERQYLDDLMRHADPVEGLNAFVARRPAVWENA